LPCDIKTSIWRSKITICSALKRFFGIARFLSKSVSLKPLGTKRPGQVKLLTLAETLFPPLPSEVIIPLAALEAQRSAMSLPGIIAAGTLGSMLGNSFWY